MQARVGDHAIFFRKAAVEITFEEKKYLVVPQAAILVLDPGRPAHLRPDRAALPCATSSVSRPRSP